MHKAMAAFVVLLLVVPIGISAQAAPTNGCMSCGTGTPAAQIPPEGLLRAAVLREVARLADTLAPTAFQQPLYQRSWVRRHPVLLGVLAGAGVGVAAAGIKCDAEAGRGERDQCRAGYWTMGPFLGGVAGFIISLRR